MLKSQMQSQADAEIPNPLAKKTGFQARIRDIPDRGAMPILKSFSEFLALFPFK